MPSDKVRFQYQEIEEIARQVYSKSEAAALVCQRLNRQVQMLEDGGWIGKAAQSFYGEMHNLTLPAVTRLERALEQFAATLQRASQDMRDAEERAAQLFRAEGGSSTLGGTNGVRGYPSGPSGTYVPMSGSNPPPKPNFDALSKFLGILSDGSGIFPFLESLKVLDKPLGYLSDFAGVIATMQEYAGQPNFGEKTLEALLTVGLEGLITSEPAGAAIIVISDANQLAGSVVSDLAVQLNAIHNNPALADAITRFDATLANADFGGVVDGVAAIGVNLFQAHISGWQQVWNNPTPLNMAIASQQGGYLALGMLDPGIQQEFLQNVMTLGADSYNFTIAALEMAPAYIDLNTNVMSVGLQGMGVSPEISEAIAQGYAATFSSNPLFAGLDAIYDAPQIDLGGMVAGLFPPN